MKYTNNKFSNTRFWSFSTRLFTAISAVVVIAVVSITVYSLSQQYKNQTHATASTTLSFSQSTIQANSGSPITDDITINPGNNFVSLVTLVIDYDSSAVTPDTTKGIVPNTQAFPSTLDGPTYNTCKGTQCTMSISLSVGNDPTKAIKTPTTVATVNFNPVSQNGTTQLAFDNQTQVFSVAPSDQANENVLSTTTPTTITIGQGSTTSPTSFPTTSGLSPTQTQTVSPTVTNNLGAGTSPTQNPSNGTPIPQPTGILVCKQRDTDNDKDVEKAAQKARQDIDNIEQAINTVVTHQDVAKSNRLIAMQQLNNDLDKANTNIQSIQNKLNIGSGTTGGCVGNFDPSNPNVVNDCNHPNAVGSTPLETFWNGIVNKFQSLFGSGQ